MADVTVIAQGENTTVVSYGEDVTVVAQEEVVTIVDAGFQGPAGRTGQQGIPGPDGGTAYVLASDMPIGGHRVVVSEVVGSEAFARYASNLNLTHANKVLGVTVAAAGTGAPVSVVRAGEVTEPSWNWVANTPVYLGDNGMLTQTQPETPALFSLIVGFPITATKLFVSVREPIIF